MYLANPNVPTKEEYHSLSGVMYTVWICKWLSTPVSSRWSCYSSCRNLVARVVALLVVNQVAVVFSNDSVTSSCVVV